MNSKIIYLRVDVDFSVGLKKGVPFLLDVFKKRGIEATFFVVMGPDTLWRHLFKMKSTNYRRRISSFNTVKLLFYFGPAVLKSLLLHVTVGRGNAKALQQIVLGGHELGIHGYDHAEWATGCYEFTQSETEFQMDKAISQFEEYFPSREWAWAAPNWKCNSHMLNYLDEHGIHYSSDLRGCSPFFPVLEGRRGSHIQFPINLPCLHEMIQAHVPKDKIFDVFSKCLDKSYNLFCIHDYYEGLMQRKLFVDLIDQLIERGYQFKSLKSAYENREYFKPKESEVSRITVPGGVMDVSCQSEFLSDNYFEVLKEF